MSQSLAARIVRAPAPFDEAFGWREVEQLAASVVIPAEAEALLTGAFGCAPYLARLARNFPEDLARMLAEPPEETLDGLLSEIAASADAETVKALDTALRRAKRRIHLLTALADLGGVWPLEDVTHALTATADAALEAAVRAHARLMGAADSATLGFFIVALGKQGAGELNYSSDIDIAAFFDPDRMDREDSGRFAVQLTKRVAASIGDHTRDGYVFRVDLRLRPDPSSTPVALSVEAAGRYYESVAQTWERAAWIKARIVAGDREAGLEFLAAMRPFVWRRTMDYAAIDEIAAITRQIADADTSRRTLKSGGVDLKRGVGGIRQIELFAQIQQLLRGGREPQLRTPPTLDALRALVEADLVEEADAAALERIYRRLRDIEHRIQMIEDQQTQEVPTDPDQRLRLARLCGCADLETFDAEIPEITGEVRAICARFFAGVPPTESPALFEGPDPDAATLGWLTDSGFTDPQAAWTILHGWAAGQPRAMRTQRARILLRKLAPRLVAELSGAWSPDGALRRFDEFIRALPAGVQILSMLDREPRLLTDLADMLSLSPRLSRELAQRPEALEAFLAFDLGELEPDVLADRVRGEVARAQDMEGALDAARRLTRETMFLIGMAALRGDTSAEHASHFYSGLAGALIDALLPCVRGEFQRNYGDIDGMFAVVGFGSFTAREMTVRSDTDIVMVYDAAEDARSAGERSLHPDTYFNRLAQRFVSALQAQTAEGSLFNIDLKLRPHGSAGPVATRFGAYDSYYRGQAWTWELMALTRARVVAGDPELAERIEAMIREILCQPRDRRTVARDVADMRARLDREKPPRGFWDLVYSPGALTDVRFTTQYLQLVHAARAPSVLKLGTRAAIAALHEAGALDAAEAGALDGSARLHLELNQLFALAEEDRLDPEKASPRFRARLARACEVGGFREVESRIRWLRSGARTVFETKVLRLSDGNPSLRR